MFVFFFKQKTAYEMRISDWSSDVCSSDLSYSSFPRNAPPAPSSRAGGIALLLPGARHPFPDRAAKDLPGRVARQGRDRSEEHTSELQSLMRISYAVFSMKKKNNRYISDYTHVVYVDITITTDTKSTLTQPNCNSTIR